MTQIFESKIRNRLGVYRLKIYDATDTITTQREVPIRGALRLRYQDLKPGYGEHILRSFARVNIDDRQGHVMEVFGSSYSETDYPVEIEGPDFLWTGCIRRGRRRRTVAPRVQRGTLRLYLYDRIAALRNVPGTNAREFWSLLFDAFSAANPHTDLVVAPGASVSNIASQEPTNYRFTGRLGAPEEYDYGTAYEQVEAVCEQLQTRAFMSCRDGKYYVRPRVEVGAETTSAWEGDLSGFGGSRTQVTIEADAVTVPRGEIEVGEGDGLDEGSDALQELTPARSVRFEGLPAPLVRDGEFEHFDDADSPILWEATGVHAPGASGYIELGEASASQPGTARQQVVRVSPVEEVFPELSFNVNSIASGSSFTVRAILHGDSGQTYYLTTGGAWSETEQGVSSDATWTATEEVPEEGLFEIEATGESIEFGQVELRFVDADGDPIDDWPTVVSGAADGERVDLEQRGVEVFSDEPPLDAWMPPADWNGEATVEAALAISRLAQQNGDPETLEATALPGLYGPGTRLLVKKPGESAESAFICVGRTLDVTAGQTQLVDVQLPEEVTS